MKFCEKHNVEKIKDKRGTWRCRKCAVEQSVLKKRRYKLQAVQYKGGKCEICGYDKCVNAFDFHHKDPDTKEFTPSQVRAWERVKKELDKCILVCSNCHREIHAEDVGEIKLIHKEARIHKCIDCGLQVYDGAVRCKKCFHISRRKVKDRPSKEVLRRDIIKLGYSATGRKYGIRDNAIRRWCKQYNIPYRKKDLIVRQHE